MSSAAHQYSAGINYACNLLAPNLTVQSGQFDYVNVHQFYSTLFHSILPMDCWALRDTSSIYYCTVVTFMLDIHQAWVCTKPAKSRLHHARALASTLSAEWQRTKRVSFACMSAGVLA